MEEKILWKGRKSRKALLHYYLFGSFLLALDLSLVLGLLDQFFTAGDFSVYLYLALAGTGLFFMMLAELKRIIVKYTVTQTRIMKEAGIFNKHMDYMPYQMIVSISSVSKWYQRILKLGSIKVDTGEDNFWIESVSNPEKIEKTINDALSSAMRRYYGEQRPYQGRSEARRRV